ncbi:putative WD repeat-containing protein [Wickerhamomyces ciferrii]|uniref:WD repeat-containing protein n=1 Tax=Wickerhamomyces ciferrii (strain ATCC 14091 / BCRC 22168 / CBS 111 / JCM 3599 / NBRC 0793 / NRRL Y-1031 F-60-10) TaxID=1206466 RepID=K0KRY8_WICCF|nr:putative WD repeat-containing protein [Wickerhamomyces ciferrii]CCH44752.1 putative WD repeat-containing protein [Wickerhamomyces ciferrii]
MAKTKPSSVIKPTIIPASKALSSNKIQFRIYVGSYEHNLLSLSILLEKDKSPVFQPIFHFQAHSLSIKSIAAAKRYLVTGSNDEHIKIYDLQKRKELGTLLGHQGSITSLKFSNEDLMSGNDSKTSNGKWLLSGSEDGKIIIWRTKDWEIFGTLKGHQGRINDLAIHPTGRIAVSVGDDKTIRLWNLMTVKKAANLKIKNDWQNGEFVRWSLDGGYFLVGLLNKLLVYKTSNASIVNVLALGKTLMHLEIYEINDVEYVVVGLGNGSLEFYELKDLINEKDDDEEIKPEPKFTLIGHTNRIKDFKLYKVDKEIYLISISSDGNIVIWDLNLKDQIAVYNTGQRLNCIEVSSESVEKFETMKRRFDSIDDDDVASASESENEADQEELKRIMKGESKKTKKSKKSKKKNTPKVSVELE